MKFLPLVFSLVLLLLIETTMQANILKPKPNLVQYQNFKSPSSKHKLPEERRKLSLFPKSKKKFVVTEEPRYNIATRSPTVLARKKPLMKKIYLQDKNPNIWNSIENNPKQPKISKSRFSNNISMIKKMEPVVFSEAVSVEINEEESKENYNIRYDKGVADNILQKDNSELITTAPYITNKDYLNLKDFILTPRSNPVEINQENKSDISFTESSHVQKYSKEDEKEDMEEFIFLDPLPSPTEIVVINSEASEEFITTEIPEKPIFFRKRRSSNIIEEENLATTVAGYKYTWKDRRLTNDMAFKNINS